MSKKAMVVDNDFFFVEFLSDLLEKRGYQVLKAYDGKEAVSALDQEDSVDLLFADILMPKIDGPQLIRLIRAKYPEAVFPIIAVSGTIIEQMDEISEMGADYYVAKGPMDKMTEQINALIDEIESQPSPVPGDQRVLEPGRLYPRRATMELMEIVEFHRAILDSLAAGVMVVDRDARVINTNTTALDMLGRPIEEVLCRPVTAVFPKTEKARLIDALKQVVHDRKRKKAGFPVSLQSRKIFVNVSLFTRKKTEIVGWVIAMEDRGAAASDPS